MLKEHSRVVDVGLRAGDLLLVGAALALAQLARDAIRTGPSQPLPPDRFLPVLLVAMLAWVGAAWLFRVYDVYRTRGLALELRRIFGALVVTGLALATFAFFGRLHQLSRLQLFLHPVIAFATLAAHRLALRGLARAARRRGRNLRYVAVVGSSGLGQEVVRSIAGHPEWGLTFAGYVLEAGAVPAPQRSPVLGPLRRLGEILESHVLDEVIFALPHHRLGDIEAAARLCEEQGVATQIVLDIMRGGIARASVADLGGLPALHFTSVPSDDVALAAKRAFDVLVSATTLLLLSPLLLAIAIAIKLDSPGPVFFRQRRIGLNGRWFWFYKFRSMRRDAEAELIALRARNEMTGPVFKMKNDPRITRIGAFIRRTSIDELPQFWNVLRGEMSVVGPRPPLPDEVRQYKRWQRRRLSVRPGITCTWQISGRNGVDFDRWMELDLRYIDTWSLWRDLEIFVKTIPAVLFARGAS